MSSLLARVRVDPYLIALLGTVGLASALPCRGQTAAVLGVLANVGIALLFFLYGGRLPRDVIAAGMTQWRLQLMVLAATFVLFPLLGLALRAALVPWMPQELAAGIVFLTVLPSTVQSSIAFTSIARGNVPAAICAATLSNLTGVFLTPALVALLLDKGDGTGTFDAVQKIVLYLLAPFVIGHALRPRIGDWLERNQSWLRYLDRGAILFVVYVAFSASVVAGIWRELPPSSVLFVGLVSVGLLGTVMVVLTVGARRLGFVVEDEIAIVFCGSKKSLASGLPMAKLLFVGPAFGLMVLPLLLFHQLQLIVCTTLASRYARRTGDS